MTVASLDLNASPRPLFDLNKYPQENPDGRARLALDLNVPPQQEVEEKQSIDVRAPLDLDLNVAPQQEAEEVQSVNRTSSTAGMFCFHLFPLFNPSTECGD